MADKKTKDAEKKDAPNSKEVVTEEPKAVAPKTAADVLEDSRPAQPQAQSTSKSRKSKVIPAGIVHIMATFNNTVVSITDIRGNVISWSSAGRCGFKGSRKSTAYAATVVAQEAARAASAQGMREAEVRVQGPGAGRESAIRAVQTSGISVTAIKDVTPIPHNGCRPPKRRRV